MSQALEALAAVDFNWTRTLRDVWAEPAYHVDDLNGDVADRILAEFFARTHSADSNPIGQIVAGRAGAGKTHLIGTLRRRVWEGRGWFVLIDIVGVADFWRTAALGFLESLSRRMPNGQTQGAAILSAALKRLSADPIARAVASGRVKPGLTKTSAVDILIFMLDAFDAAETRKHKDVVRALALLDSKDMEISNAAAEWLQSHEGDEDKRRALGFKGGPPPPPQEIVRGLNWIMGVSGPTLIAIDQIDAIVSEANAAASESGDAAKRANAILQTIASGLMDLHDLKRRAMTLVSCLESTWPILREKTVASAADRFRELTALPPVVSAPIAERLISSRMAHAYSACGFTPPYPTYPFARAAVDSAVGLRPRAILMRCREFQESCLVDGEMRECVTLALAPSKPMSAAQASAMEVASLDEVFQMACAASKPPDLDDETALGARLGEIAELYLRQLTLPDTIDGEATPDPNPRNPALHARLAFVFHQEQHRQQRWSFRALSQESPMAFQSRLKAAITASGVDANMKWRRLVVLRRSPPPAGPKTAELVKEFLELGGRIVAPSAEDFAMFGALIDMAREAPPGFETWLKLRRPLFGAELFREAGLAPPDCLPSERMGPPPVLADIPPRAFAPIRVVPAAAPIFVAPPPQPAAPPPAALAAAAAPVATRQTAAPSPTLATASTPVQAPLAAPPPAPAAVVATPAAFAPPPTLDAAPAPFFAERAVRVDPPPPAVVARPPAPATPIAAPPPPSPGPEAPVTAPAAPAPAAAAAPVEPAAPLPAASEAYQPAPPPAPPHLEEPPANFARAPSRAPAPSQIAALSAMLTPAVRPPAAPPLRPPPRRPASERDYIPIGRAFDRGAALGPVTLLAELLPRHVAALAGAGAGKSVLVSRMVEEAALIGIPSLVIDFNEDLTRLAQPWPSRPEAFTDDDARKARAYFEHVEVAVWTPRSSDGRPFSLPALPNFADLGASPSAEEREAALDMARATIEPYLPGHGARAVKMRGVLSDVLRRFAAARGATLDELVQLLYDLPEEASRLPDAADLARDIADVLVQAISVDPLLQDMGTPLDPTLLFESPTGKTRVSVLNLSGLKSEQAREGFVNQLQMALFTWIKQNAPPTGCLLVIDDAHLYAPAKAQPACKLSARALMAQGRRHGLGLIFATPEPRALDTEIAAGCATQFFGRVSGPASLGAMRELMSAAGGGADDLAHLRAGEFYFVTDGFIRPVKIRAPLCLTKRSETPAPNQAPPEEARARA